MRSHLFLQRFFFYCDQRLQDCRFKTTFLQPSKNYLEVALRKRDRHYTNEANEAPKIVMVNSWEVIP